MDFHEEFLLWTWKDVVYNFYSIKIQVLYTFQAWKAFFNNITFIVSLYTCSSIYDKHSNILKHFNLYPNGYWTTVEWNNALPTIFSNRCFGRMVLIKETILKKKTKTISPTKYMVMFSEACLIYIWFPF